MPDYAILPLCCFRHDDCFSPDILLVSEKLSDLQFRKIGRLQCVQCRHDPFCSDGLVRLEGVPLPIIHIAFGTGDRIRRERPQTPCTEISSGTGRDQSLLRSVRKHGRGRGEGA